MQSIVIRPKAVADLAEIWAYIAEDSVREADSFASLIHKDFRMLSRQPRMGRERPELLTDLRSFAIRKYVIFYLARPRGIEVVRVLHGARDLKPFFEQDID